ncbi:MAG: hypothetical protein U5S82_19980 [Gammaproteobacteria bacterium]|nr:hypothetical protein [Gammaproteobacteria bacterium]
MKNICWLILIFVTLPASAIGEGLEKSYEKHNSKDMAGWKKDMAGWKGIVFICSIDSSDKVLEKICRRAETDIELLAASNNVPLKVVDANKFAHAVFFASANDFIILEYELMATQSRGNYDAKAVHARLTFEAFYLNAIEKDSKPTSTNNIPRSGYLELWSRSVIGSGTPNGIVEPFSNGAETHIKKALILYLKYSK